MIKLLNVMVHIYNYTIPFQTSPPKVHSMLSHDDFMETSSTPIKIDVEVYYEQDELPLWIAQCFFSFLLSAI